MERVRITHVLIILSIVIGLAFPVVIADGSQPKANILIDEHHGEGLGSDLIDELVDRGFDVETMDDGLDETDLKDYDLLVIAAPDAEIDEGEIEHVIDFVEDGGALLLLGRAGGVIDSMNDLSENFGITFNDDALQESSADPENENGTETETEPDLQVVIRDFADHRITKEVESISYWTDNDSGCTLSISGPASAIASGDEESFSTVYEVGSRPPVLCHSSHGKGDVVAYGSSASWTKSQDRSDDGGGIGSKDNERLALNVFHYLTDTTTIDLSKDSMLVKLEAGASEKNSIKLRNMDNVKAENVRLKVEGTAKNWTTLSEDEFDIDDFGYEDLRITVEPPKKTEIKTYSAEILVGSDNAGIYKGNGVVDLLIIVEDPGESSAAAEVETNSGKVDVADEEEPLGEVEDDEPAMVEPQPDESIEPAKPTGRVDPAVQEVRGADAGSARIPTIMKDGQLIPYIRCERPKIALGEEAEISFCAINTIAKPPMALQLILMTPPEVKVQSRALARSGAGLYTATYNLDPGETKYVTANLGADHVCEFDAKGIICYYFGDDKDNASTVVDVLRINVSMPDEGGDPGKAFTKNVGTIDDILTRLMRSIEPLIKNQYVQQHLAKVQNGREEGLGYHIPLPRCGEVSGTLNLS